MILMSIAEFIIFDDNIGIMSIIMDGNVITAL